jgi:futalosine hydrolase
VSARVCHATGTNALQRCARLPSKRVLVVAATELELELIEGAETLCCGIGPVEAAHTTARALARAAPEALLHIGLAGARSLPPGTVVLGAEAVYCDLVDPTRSFPRVERATPDQALLDRARRALPRAVVLPIGTSARVGGGAGRAEVEAMEGFAVLRAAAAAGVPALELRAISNAYDDDRDDWRVEEALEALAAAVATLIDGAVPNHA